jgi:dimethylaniline monooxygenase (N-oxide forming)
LLNSIKTAVIGAGPSGLATAGSLDLSKYTIFEKQPSIGGMWQFPICPDGLAYSGLETNISKYNMHYPGVPHDGGTPLFLSVEDVQKYLEKYSELKGLANKIHNGASVTSVVPNNDGHWSIGYEENGKTYTERYNNVVIASGFFSEAYIPPFRDLANFKGEIFHSSEFKNASYFKGKRVAVVGSGFSGVDIASILADDGIEVVHITRRKSIILGRMLEVGGRVLPIDLALNSRVRKVADDSSGKPSLPMTQEELNQKRNAYLLGLSKQNSVDTTTLRIDPNSRDFFPVTISDGYIENVAKGKISLVLGSIDSFAESSISCEDGDFNIDCLIFATGYRYSLPFLNKTCRDLLDFSSDKLLQPSEAYKSVFNSNIPNLYFVGAHKGPYWSQLFLQANLVAGLISGEISLTPEEYLAGIEESISLRMKNPAYQQLTYPYNVVYCDSLARVTGNFPCVELDPSLDSLLYGTAVTPNHYGINGPNSSPEICRHNIVDLSEEYFS